MYNDWYGGEWHGRKFLQKEIILSVFDNNLTKPTNTTCTLDEKHIINQNF